MEEIEVKEVGTQENPVPEADEKTEVRPGTDITKENKFEQKSEEQIEVKTAGDKKEEPEAKSTTETKEKRRKRKLF